MGACRRKGRWREEIRIKRIEILLFFEASGNFHCVDVLLSSKRDAKNEQKQLRQVDTCNPTCLANHDLPPTSAQCRRSGNRHGTAGLLHRV